MVQILPSVPTFGQMFAQKLGAGIEKGADAASHFGQQIASEKIKQSLMEKKALAGNPYANQANPRDTSSSVMNNPIQSSSSYQDQAILTPQQIEQEGNKLAYQRTIGGMPTTPEEGMAIVRQKNADIASHRDLQRNYGDISESALNKVYKDASDEQKAFIRRKGEGYAQEGLSEAQIQRKAAVDAKNFKNMISQAEKAIPKNRAQSALREAFTGRSATTDTAIRNKVKPLLDAGLYDTARDILSKANYDLEERESIVSSLGETARRGLAEMPSFSKGKVSQGIASFDKPLSEDQRNIAKESIGKILASDPATNLVLLRKAAEDKGVDWRTFRDIVNDSVMSGDFKMDVDSDQFKFLEALDQPPLGKLDKILHGLKLIGR